MFYSETETLLNERNELYKKCRHKKKFKLNKSDLCSIYMFYVHLIYLLNDLNNTSPVLVETNV